MASFNRESSRTSTTESLFISHTTCQANLVWLYTEWIFDFLRPSSTSQHLALSLRDSNFQRRIPISMGSLGKLVLVAEVFPTPMATPVYYRSCSLEYYSHELPVNPCHVCRRGCVPYFQPFSVDLDARSSHPPLPGTTSLTVTAGPHP